MPREKGGGGRREFVKPRGELLLTRRRTTAVVEVWSDEALPVGKNTPDRQLYTAIHWRGPWGTQRERRDDYISFNAFEITLHNLTESSMHCALVVPGEHYGGGEYRIVDEDIELGPAGLPDSTRTVHVRRSDYSGSGCGLLYERIVHSVVGDEEVEVGRICELQVEVPGGNLVEGSRTTICKINVVADYNCSGKGGEDHIYREPSLSGELVEKAPYQMQPALGHLPDDGYTQVGYSWKDGSGEEWQPIQLMWCKDEMPVAPLRWKNMEDGGIRLIIPALNLAKIDDYLRPYYKTAASTMEWAFNEGKGGWFITRPTGDLVKFSLGTQPSEVTACTARTPVIVFSTRREINNVRRAKILEVVETGHETTRATNEDHLPP